MEPNSGKYSYRNSFVNISFSFLLLTLTGVTGEG